MRGLGFICRYLGLAGLNGLYIRRWLDKRHVDCNFLYSKSLINVSLITCIMNEDVQIKSDLYSVSSQMQAMLCLLLWNRHASNDVSSLQ